MKKTLVEQIFTDVVELEMPSFVEKMREVSQEKEWKEMQDKIEAVFPKVLKEVMYMIRNPSKSELKNFESNLEELETIYEKCLRYSVKGTESFNNAYIYIAELNARLESVIRDIIKER